MTRMTRAYVTRSKMSLPYVLRPKIFLAYVLRPKSASPISLPTRNHEGTISTSNLKACRKTPTMNIGTHSDVRRKYPIDIPIGDISLPILRKLLHGVIATVHVLVCTGRTEFRYLRLKWVQSYRVNEFLLGTAYTRKTVGLWQVISWSISSQFSRINTRSISTRRVLSILLVLYAINQLQGRNFEVHVQVQVNSV